MKSFDSSVTFPRSGDELTVLLKNVVTSPFIEVGDFTYYHDFEDVRAFERKNVLYHYPYVNHDRLRIGRYCSIASGANFLFNGGNHKSAAFANFPFAIFPELFEHEFPVQSGWDNKGDIVIGNDVWIGYQALVMAGVTIGDGARIGSRAIVTRDVAPYAVVAGSPAREVKRRFPAEVIAKLQKLAWWDWEPEKVRAHLEALTHADLQALDVLLEAKR